MKRIGISTDCVCDLPEDYLRENDVDVMHFYITTDTGKFRDGYGVTSENLLEYLEEGGAKAETNPPAPEEYRAFFEHQLERCDELIHVALSSHVGLSCNHARAAAQAMGEDQQRVTVVDSENLSTGLGHIVMKAVELRDEGLPAAEIVKVIQQMKYQISTTFITRSADYLASNGRMGQGVRKLCEVLRLHPVLMMKNGRLTLQTLRAGNYEKAVMRYARSVLNRGGRVDRKRLFITHAGCTVKLIAQIRAEAERQRRFDDVIVTRASATISGNCGPGMVGVILMRY